MAVIFILSRWLGRQSLGSSTKVKGCIYRGNTFYMLYFKDIKKWRCLTMIYAVIPTGNRPKEYQSVIDWCKNKGIETVTIATSEQSQAYASGQVVRDNTLNISRWWNIGINIAYANNAEHVFVFNDDAVLPDDWADRIVEALDAGYSGASSERPIGKISGWAFGLNGKSHILADEKLVWWYGDDDLQRQCEQAGGFAIVPRMDVGNLYANSSYYDRNGQIAKDAEYYRSKWGQ